jgi:hypothetical protein
MFVKTGCQFLEIKHPNVGHLILNVEKISRIQSVPTEEHDDEFYIEFFCDETSHAIYYKSIEERDQDFEKIRDCLFNQ